MYLLTILLKNNNQITQYYFDQFKDADAVVKSYDSGFDGGSNMKLAVEDDYGSRGVLKWNDISLVSFSDIDKNMEAQEKLEWGESAGKYTVAEEGAGESGGAVAGSAAGDASVSVAYGIFDYTAKEYLWVGTQRSFEVQGGVVSKFIGSRGLGSDVRIHNDAVNCPNDSSWTRVRERNND